MANTLAWGFHRLANVADQSVTSVQPTAIRTAINEYLTFRTNENNGVLSTFTEITTDVSARFKVPASVMRLQGLTELGRPRTERYNEAEYTVAWPIQKAGLALGQTYEQRVKMSIAQFAGLIENVGDADLTWLRDHALMSLFYNGTGWFHDDLDDPAGELTIKGLANSNSGDNQQYFKIGATGAMGTDDHYYAQALDVATASDPVPAIIDELKEHPGNAGDVIIIVPYVDRLKWSGLGQFYAMPNPNVTPGSGVTQFTGSAPATDLGEFLGYHLSDAYIYTWRGMPQNYFVAFTSGNAEKALRQREHPEAVLRGFRPEADREDYPYFETDYVRRAGFGGWNRTGAVVGRYNNAAYAIPTGYTPPQP